MLEVAATLLVLILIVTLAVIDLRSSETSPSQPDAYVGVAVGFGDENDVYRVADAVKGFANLIIIGSLDVTMDTAALTRVCNYLYERDFSFIVFVGFASEGYYPPRGPDRDFFNTTVLQWGGKFLGAYIFDEIGGKQLDYAPGTPLYGAKPVKDAANITDATGQFVHVLNSALTSYTGPSYYDAPRLQVFTSDYALYWFDYLFGYNVVLGEFTGNHSRQLTLSLCRGAATAQHMQWGTMITWKYSHAPFLEVPAQLYSDMVLAYEHGANYILVFDSPDNQSATTDLGILTQGHLDAMQQFWNYAIKNPRAAEIHAEVAYVLPRDFGFGFRGPTDSIWGLWPANETAVKVWNDVNVLVSQCGKNLDIVYETLTNDIPVRLMYNTLIYWNGTIIGQPAS
jgi:hypothetical protein